MEIWAYPLTYYCEPGRTPFHSITALPTEEAMRKAAELAPDTRSPKNRFCAAARTELHPRGQYVGR